MIMIQTISLMVMVFSGIIFVGSCVANSGPKPPKVGDIYSHANPGTSDDPTKPARPFVMLTTVLEVADGNVKVHNRYMHADGYVFDSTSWKKISDLSIGETKLKEGQ